MSATHPSTVVSLVTSHGRQQLRAEGGERVIDLLNRHGVPWSALSIYAVKRGDTREAVLYPCLEKSLQDMTDVEELLLYFNRNVNPYLFSVQNFKCVDSEGEGEAAEYIYQRFDNSRGTAETYLKKLSVEECRQAIADRVAETIRAHVPRGAKLVVGVSGGGDSNALLYALSRLEPGLVEIHPLIIKGIPDWDLGVPRAREICATYGMELEVMEESAVKSLLGMRESTSLVDRFENEFKGDDFEFLGTLLIRLALFARARTLGTSYVATGLNLEDVLCEAMFRISTGLKVASFPSRLIGECSLIMPLWLCPKRMIDGCFPKLSRENYDARYPCFSLGRNLYYSVIYSMQSQFPGFMEQLARGLSRGASEDPVHYAFDEQLGFHVERFVPFPLRQRFKRMIDGGSPVS
jgi:tRNA(Ile)-lysidine synthase TilS/MesJ